MLRPLTVCICITIALSGILFLFQDKFIRSNPHSYTKISDVGHSSVADYLFLKDEKKNRWIYKQITDLTPDVQIVIVLEAWASDIARAVGVPVNEAKLIPSEEPFPFRMIPGYPGSMHLKVLGKTTEEDSPWPEFDIHQKMRTPFQIKKLGPLPEQDIGLRKEIIQNIARHPDLGKIAALDTFTGNTDRSNSNLFFDRKTNAFFGIDMGNCLMCNLSNAAVTKIKQVGLSPELKIHLKDYQMTLADLIQTFPPEKSIALLKSHLETAGFVPQNKVLWDDDVQQKIKKWIRSIHEYYESSNELNELLKN